MQVLHDMCFLPVVLALAFGAAGSGFHGAALLYFVPVALLTRGVWELSVRRGDCLDIRTVGMGFSGRQLLLCAAVLAAAAGHSVAFMACIASAVLWTAAWLPAGSSVTWSELLRLGLQAGVLVGAF